MNQHTIDFSFVFRISSFNKNKAHKLEAFELHCTKTLGFAFVCVLYSAIRQRATILKAKRDVIGVTFSTWYFPQSSLIYIERQFAESQKIKTTNVYPNPNTYIRDR